MIQSEFQAPWSYRTESERLASTPREGTLRKSTHRPDTIRKDGLMTACPLTIVLVLVLSIIQALPSVRECSAETRESMDKGVRRGPAVSRTEQGETSSLGTGDLYALAVGVSHYKNTDVPKLKCADVDARAFAEFLKTQKKVFKNIHVTLLENEKATKVELEKYLNYELRRAGKDDTVILFFSGHGSGEPTRPGDYYFLTCDADPKYLEATAVRMSGLNFLKGIDARRVLLIADACHAGAFSTIQTKAVDKALNVFMRQFKESSGLVCMTSSKPTEYSQEKTSLEQSVFTHYLLKGLKGEADTDRDGVVTVKEAYDYVYERTKNETSGAQHPQLETAVVGSFPISVLGTLEDAVQLEMWIVAQDHRCTNPACIDPPDATTVCDDPLCTDVSITDGGTMYSGQNYQIAFRPSATGYVYVYQIDSKGDIYKLFPGHDFICPDNKLENPLKGGQIYWIPAQKVWLRHDNQEGKEKIYVVASRSRNQVLEDLYAHVQKARSEAALPGQNKEVQDEMRDYLDRTMGPTKVLVKKAKCPKDVTVVGVGPESQDFLSHVIESSGLDAAKSVWFWHKNK